MEAVQRFLADFAVGWGWHPVVFVILLLVSLGLAWLVSKTGWRIIWLLPALVLYFGLDWSLPGWVGTLVQIVFWVSLVVALVTALLPLTRTRLARVPIITMAVVIILGLIIQVSYALMTDEPDRVVDEPTSDQDVCVTIDGIEDEEIQTSLPERFTVDADGNCETILPDDDPEEGVDEEPTAVCPARYEQELDPNRKFRFDSDGLRGTSRQKRREFVANLGHDYRYLAFVGEQLFGRMIKDGSLVTGDRKCLDAKGQRLHAKVEGALMASGVKNGKASANGYNTGMQNGKAVVAKRRGVYGDRSATIFTLPDGTTLTVLDRCGNLALGSKPKGVPEGKTDNSRPPRQPKPTAPKPPSGEGGPTPPALQSKPSNPDRYKVEEEAPKASTENQPATKPSKVTTTKTGGGGVTDSPTKEPGSETGVQAPDAEPAPTSSPPPPEDGANDPSDGETECVKAPGMSTC